MGREGIEIVMGIEYVVVSSFLSCQIWNERSYSKDYIVVSLLVCAHSKHFLTAIYFLLLFIVVYTFYTYVCII